MLNFALGILFIVGIILIFYVCDYVRTKNKERGEILESLQYNIELITRDFLEKVKYLEKIYKVLDKTIYSTSSMWLDAIHQDLMCIKKTMEKDKKEVDSSKSNLPNVTLTPIVLEDKE